MYGNPQLLRSFDFSADGNIDEELRNVKGRNGKDVNYLAGIWLRITLSLSSAGTSDAITRDQWAKILPQLDIEDANGESLFDRRLSLAFFYHIKRYLERLSLAHIVDSGVSANSGTTHTKEIGVYIPYYLPRMKDPDLFLQPSSFMLRRVQAKWGASDIFGTGQTIQAATKMEMYADHVPLDKLKHRSMLRYGALSVQSSSFRGQPLPLRGRVLALIVGDVSGGATGSIGTTDFTDYELHGTDLSRDRQQIEVPAHLYNQMILDEDAQITVVGDSAVHHFPLYAYPDGAKLSQMPSEREPTVDLITGAGSPSAGDQEFLYAVARPLDGDKLSRGLGQSRDFTVDVSGMRQIMLHSGRPEGLKGTIDPQSPIAPFLPKTLITEIKQRGDC